MINTKLLQTSLPLDACILISLAFSEQFVEIKRLFKYYKPERYEAMIIFLESELYIKSIGDKIELRKRALDCFSDISIEAVIDKYMELFPKGIKNISGHYIRSNRKDVSVKLKRLIVKHKLDHEKLLLVTKEYVDSWALKDYTYMKNSMYYIEKDGYSTLVDDYNNYVEEVQNKLTGNLTIKNFG